ncbi:uncharacterized protein BT62DRAFT_1006318 [Guyanagaster necrorhizus]|uniref:Uncharacterized protein n=1 Tax=Guyanagaster necrorhizus TaxID=856835 RepID=A0A9P7VT72_9AGAR|nr:uncharacterized protein BT62DRAFT_1006318 [Guyanagaster necrorhizus MCA 3950]KAG7446112.1 hypothetical protein BT62DRAFT_1006318 [Guyanagaster necrorhizus MCA 3950]
MDDVAARRERSPPPGIIHIDIELLERIEKNRTVSKNKKRTLSEGGSASVTEPILTLPLAARGTHSRLLPSVIYRTFVKVRVGRDGTVKFTRANKGQRYGEIRKLGASQRRRCKNKTTFTITLGSRDNRYTRLNGKKTEHKLQVVMTLRTLLFPSQELCAKKNYLILVCNKDRERYTSGTPPHAINTCMGVQVHQDSNPEGAPSSMNVLMHV